MVTRWLALALAIGTTSPSTVNQARPPAPRPRSIFASAYGTHGFEVRVRYEDLKIVGITGKLFTYDRQGAEKILWERELAYVPKRVLVSDFGAVVALGDKRQHERKHALVVFDKAGAVVADYALGDVLTPDEARSHSNTWDAYSAIRFTRDTLCMRFSWGREIKVDLVTGNIRPG